MHTSNICSHLQPTFQMGLHNPVLFHYDVEWERQSVWEGGCVIAAHVCVIILAMTVNLLTSLKPTRSKQRDVWKLFLKSIRRWTEQSSSSDDIYTEQNLRICALRTWFYSHIQITFHSEPWLIKYRETLENVELKSHLGVIQALSLTFKSHNSPRNQKKKVNYECLKYSCGS